SLGHRFGKVEEPLRSIGETVAVAGDAPGPRFLENLDGEGDEAGIPVGDPARVEGQAVNSRVLRDLAPDLVRVGQPVLVPPRPGEFDACHLGRRTIAVKRPGGLDCAGLQPAPSVECGIPANADWMSCALFRSTLISVSPRPGPVSRA